MFDLTNAIIDYESGELEEHGVIELFQHLVDSGLAWQLQGSYGRTAQALIDADLVTPFDNRSLEERTGLTPTDRSMPNEP
jgi:hypothetical protein